MTKKSYMVYKRTESGPELAYCMFLNIIYWNIFISFQMTFTVRFWLTFGSIMVHLGKLVQSVEVIHLREPVWSHIIQISIYRGVCDFAEPSRGIV